MVSRPAEDIPETYNSRYPRDYPGNHEVLWHGVKDREAHKNCDCRCPDDLDPLGNSLAVTEAPYEMAKSGMVKYPVIQAIGTACKTGRRQNHEGCGGQPGQRHAQQSQAQAQQAANKPQCANKTVAANIHLFMLRLHLFKGDNGP